jgi:hypothetical protein
MCSFVTTTEHAESTMGRITNNNVVKEIQTSHDARLFM